MQRKKSIIREDEDEGTIISEPVPEDISMETYILRNLNCYQDRRIGATLLVRTLSRMLDLVAPKAVLLFLYSTLVYSTPQDEDSGGDVNLRFHFAHLVTLVPGLFCPIFAYCFWVETETKSATSIVLYSRFTLKRHQ